MGYRNTDDPVPTVFTHNRDRLLEKKIVTYGSFGFRDTMHGCDDTHLALAQWAPPSGRSRPRGFGGPGGGV